MKKIVGTIAAIALASSVAFAEVGIGSWGRAVFTPVYSDGNNIRAAEGVSWYMGGQPRVGISVHGESENVGFNIDMNVDEYATKGINIGDTAFFWAKPWNFLTIKIGKCLDDTGRGNAGFGSTDWDRTFRAAGFDDDFTFKRFGINNGGAIVKLEPIEGLWAIASVDVNPEQSLAENVYSKGQYGAGYVINNIGHLRAQYNGAYKFDDAHTAKTINAAFDLTAVENLLVSVGAFIPVESGNPTVIAAYVRLALDPVTLHIGEQATINNSAFSNKAAVGADVDFGNGVGLNADVRFETSSAQSDLSFMAGLKKNLSGGFVGVGFEAKLANLTNSATFTWGIPVVIQAGF